MYESRTTAYTAQADVDATLSAEIMPGTLVRLVQFLTDEKPTKILFSELPPVKNIPAFFDKLYGNPHISFPREHNV